MNDNNDIDNNKYPVSLFNDRNNKLWKYVLYLLLIHTLWESLQLWIGMSSLKRFTGYCGINDIIMDTIMFISGGILVYIIIEGK